jgi:hypothetical protein
MQHCSGTGTIYAITVDAQRQIDYMIEIPEGKSNRIQPGILEHEITLLDPDTEPSATSP